MTLAREEPVAHIQEILEPLQQHEGSFEYLQQFQKMVEMDRQLRRLENIYTDLLSRVSDLENIIEKNKR